MKKKILGGFAVLAVAVAVAFNVNMNSEKNELSDLALANVEALAEEDASKEGKYSPTKTKITTYEYNEDGSVKKSKAIEVICCPSGSAKECTAHSEC